MPVTALRPSDPTRLGPHRLLARLGQGGMGTVFLGVSPDERAVAVKVLRDGVADPEVRRRFRHELDALRRVRGPHLVEMLDADVDADTPYLVTRFVPGQRLDDLVARSGPLPATELHQLARGLADALTALHGAGVVHRDLTPGNVLVLDGQPYVIDLGLATAADVTSLTHSGLVIGTPGYLAPEQVTGCSRSPAVDVHAWGATVAFAGTGRPPYGTGRPEAVLYRVVHETPDLDGLPASLARLVVAAMDPDPQQRPLARTLLAELGGASVAEPVTVHLPHDVSATTVLVAGVLQPPVRQLATATSGPRATVSLPYDQPPYDQPPYDQPPYDVGPEPYEPDQQPWHDDEPPPRTSPVRSLQVVLTGAAALALVAAGTLVAPVVGATTALLLLVALRAAGRGSERLRDRRERRGDRRRDPVMTTLGAPWQLAHGTADTVLSLPLLMAVAAVPAGALWLLDPGVSGLDRTELTAATATVVALAAGLRRRVHRPSRQLLRRALLSATPGPISAVAVLLAVTAIAGLLLATAEGAAPSYWPAVRLRS
ncbi:MAG: serine/threonine-protein kinase [Mycobacteriales bacterium]